MQFDIHVIIILSVPIYNIFFNVLANKIELIFLVLYTDTIY